MALAPQQFCVRWNSYHSNLQTVFPKLLSTENFADVTLACENRQLRCHKVVLSACSAYFERLLVQNPCKHPIIFMKDMRFSEMQSLVDFMYKGEVNVTQDDLPSLLKSAEALQIRGLCSSEAGGAEAAPAAKGTQTSDGRDFTLASEALLRAQLDCADGGGGGGGGAARQPERAGGPCGKKRRAEGAPAPAPTVKEETVEEDGLFYGELDNDDIEFNEDEDTDKPSGSLAQPSASVHPTIRVKPESKLFLSEKPRNDSDYLARLSQMNGHEIQSEFAKYGFTTGVSPEGKTVESRAKLDENDYYKSWLEQNGELEVSLLRVTDKLKKKAEAHKFLSEIELIPKTKTKSLLEKTLTNETRIPAEAIKTALPQMKKFARRGRPPLFKDKYFDIGGTSLKADLDQFLEGKEVSSSGLSRKDLERVMMGKFNPNRRYSNEAMWAALMDVKKGGSIYRAAQTHKVPRKSLRNWMKRCHIKSSFPMPQQLKQFVENNKKQKSPGCPELQGPSADLVFQDGKGVNPDVYSHLETGFGKHFLTFNSNVSSDDEVGLVVEEGEMSKDTKVGLIETRADFNDAQPGLGDAILNMSMRD